MRVSCNGMKSKIKEIFNIKKCLSMKNMTRDHVDLDLWGLHLSVRRETTSDVPSELSVIIPRVELRRDCKPQTPVVCDTEIILNSITVVIAPRHPQEGGSPPSSPTVLKKAQLSEARTKRGI